MGFFNKKNKNKSNQNPTNTNKSIDKTNQKSNTNSITSDDNLVFRNVEDLNRFYRSIQNMSLGSVKLSIILGVALCISVLSNVYFAKKATEPDRQYFAADNGRIIKMVPLSNPYVQSKDVIQFAKDALLESFSLDFLNYKKNLETAKTFYTKKGFESFIDSLKSSGFIELIKEKRMNMTITTLSGVIPKEGVSGDSYFWNVEIPISIRIVGQNNEILPQKFIAKMKIERISVLDSVKGIGVSQLITVKDASTY